MEVTNVGTKLNTSSLGASVIVNVRGEKGTYFVGKLLGHKQVASPYKNETGIVKNYEVYEFAVEDTTMETHKKEGKEYKNVDVAAGDAVSIFAPTRLNNALRQAEVGWKIKITYLGLGKATKFGGKPHDYEVEVI
jgi:hypothetical protein